MFTKVILSMAMLADSLQMVELISRELIGLVNTRAFVSTNPTDQPITSGLPSLGRRASFVWRETGEVPKRKPSAVRHGSAEQAMRKIVCARRETPKIPARFFAMKLLEADIDRALGSAV
jgi:hypothetical protein